MQAGRARDLRLPQEEGKSTKQITKAEKSSLPSKCYGSFDFHNTLAT
jgi:hypothetical protein